MNFFEFLAALPRLFGVKKEPKPPKTVGFTNQPWEPEMRVVLPGHYGPNMPKYQPCPEDQKGSKRVRKTVGGAFYHCCKHGEFFVRRG